MKLDAYLQRIRIFDECCDNLNIQRANSIIFAHKNSFFSVSGLTKLTGIEQISFHLSETQRFLPKKLLKKPLGKNTKELNKINTTPNEETTTANNK